jgi:NADH dehydrogenase (ubiquinone) 1 alpha subcomplex subunit 5
MISKLVKETTRITGLNVAKHPQLSLTVLYEKILYSLEKMPDQAAYKQHTKKLVETRLDLVKAIKDVEQLEAKINSGQIEEVIKEAENELILARSMLEWKPWEKLIAQAPKDQWKWPVA